MVPNDKDVFKPDKTYLFDLLMENVTDSIYFKDLESQFLAISKFQAERMGLKDPNEAIGKTDFDMFSHEHAKQAFDDEQEIIETGNPIIGKEERETFGDREDLWVSSTKLPMRDPDGNIIGTFGISRDITSKKTFQIKLEESEARLREHLDRIEKELKRAQIVINALMPTGVPPSRHFETAFRYLPTESIGGDYVNFYPMESEGIGVFAGDVSGHGVSAALFVTVLKFLTDYIVDEFGDAPSDFIQALNEDLQNEFPAISVSAIYGRLYPKSKDEPAAFEFAAGGHPAPVMIHSSGKVSMLAAPGTTALGTGGTFEPEYARVNLEPSDRILIFSNGLSETKSKMGQVIKPEKLTELIENSNRDTPEETVDAIIEAITEYRGEQEATDDIVLVCVESK